MSAKGLRTENQVALDALDQAIAARPEKDGHAFSEATEHLCLVRERLIAERRGNPGSDDTLERVNAIISTSLAGHFPLGNIPWDEVEHARGELARLIERFG